MSKKNWVYDLSKCPDCGLIQSKPKKKLDECEREGCESYVIEYGKKNKKYGWWNPNWG